MMNAFRTGLEFDQWLREAKGTSTDQLNKNWWKTYGRTKWGNQGKLCKTGARGKGLEMDGNTVPKTSHLPEERNSIVNRFCQVYWPEDNLTRVCHVLAYDETRAVYQVFYFFDEKAYDEFFDSDWQVIHTEDNKACDFRDLAEMSTNSSSNYVSNEG